MDNMLETKNCEINYKKFQLGPISTGIRRGMITTLIGRNGSGKTTFLKGSSGLRPFQKGEVLFAGQEIDFLDPHIRTKMTYISNEIQMYPNFTVKEALQFVSSLHQQWDDQWVNEMMKTFRIDEKKKINELSKGMKMKVNLLLGLGHKPKLILLDEPMDGLDSISRQQFFDMLQELMEEDEERAILLSTHYTKDVEGICDYALFLKDGSLALEGIVEDLKEQYKIFSLPPEVDVTKMNEVIAWTKGNSFEIKGLIGAEDIHLLPEVAVIKSPSLDDLFFYFVERGLKG